MDGRAVCASAVEFENASKAGSIPVYPDRGKQNLVANCYKVVRTAGLAGLSAGYGLVRSFATNAAWVRGIRSAKNASTASA